MAQANEYDTRTQLAFGGTQLIGGRYERIAVVARTPLAVQITALDRSTSPAKLVMLALPDDALETPQLAALRERFRRLAHLSHPSIPSYRPGSTIGACWCVSDCIDGETLAELVVRRAPERLAREEMDSIVQKLGSALATAHEAGISHGAVSLENVIVTPALDVRLTGFDLGDKHGHLDFAPAADVTALESLADSLEGVHAAPEIPLPLKPPLPPVPDPPLHASRRSPEKRPRRRRGGLRIAAVAALALAILVLNPGDLLRFVRSTAVPFAGTGTLPGELPRESRQLAVLAPDVAAESPVRPVESRIENGGVLPAPENAHGDEPTVAEEAPVESAGLHESERAADFQAVVSDVDVAPADDNDVAPSRQDDVVPSSDQGVDAPADSGENAPAPADQGEDVPADRNDVVPAVTLRFSPAGLVTVNENDASAQLTLRPLAGRSAEIIWWSADDSAQRGSDYGDLGVRSANIPANSAVEIVVPLIGDVIAEADEVFEIYASAVENGRQVGVPVRAAIRIVDDD